MMIVVTLIFLCLGRIASERITQETG